MNWVHLTLIGGLYVFGSIALALAGLFAFRRVVSHHVLAPHNDVAGFIYATVAVTYAVILGFVTVTVWEQFEDARNNADHEANVVADLYRLSAWMPEADRPQIQQAIVDYANSVVNDEWKAMDEGTAPDPQTAATLDNLWTLYYGAEPHLTEHTAQYDASIDLLDSLGNDRRMRLLEARYGIPGIVWVILVAGGIITIVFAYGFGVERGPSHAVMLATLAASITLLLFMISTLNYAFHGDVRVQPDAMNAVIRQFQGR